MLTKKQAIKKVEDRVNKFDSYWPDKPKMKVIDKDIIEKKWGWIFFYQSSEYLKTGDCCSQLVGNAPYLVNKENGKLIETGTAQPLEHYIASYEEGLKCQ